VPVIIAKTGDGEEMPGRCTDRYFVSTMTMKTSSFTATNNKFLNGYEYALLYVAIMATSGKM
jgi:hypothetical protein